MPLVSICIPAYHADNFISDALNSIRKQSFTDWELIVTEDGSKDNLEKIVRSFANEVSQRVIYIRHEENQGLSAARNTCIKKAIGDYIALLDADDYWVSTHLETIINQFSTKNADIVHSGSILIDNNTAKELEIRAPSESQIDNFLISLYNHTYIIQPSSAVLRNEVFSTVGLFDVHFRHCEDLEFWFRSARTGCIFSFTGKNTCFYRRHDNSLSVKSSVKMAEAVAEIYSKHLDWSAISNALRLKNTALAYANAGRMHFRLNPSRSSSFYFKAWKINPIQPQYFALALLEKVKAIFR